MPRYSLTEIETHCRKAARGAGYEWGEAEEAGKAVRRLCAAGIDGVTELLELLQTVDGKVDTYRPNAGLFKGDPQQQICGLSLGCALADRKMDTLPEGINIIAPMIAQGVMQANLGNAAPVTEVSDATWKALNSFAHRTYVPATKESRLKGAG